MCDSYFSTQLSTEMILFPKFVKEHHLENKIIIMFLLIQKRDKIFKVSLLFFNVLVIYCYFRYFYNKSIVGSGKSWERSSTQAVSFVYWSLWTCKRMRVEHLNLHCLFYNQHLYIWPAKYKALNKPSGISLRAMSEGETG